jgi:hypothetical protein
VLTAVKIVFLFLKHLLLVVELTYWEIMLMKIIDTYILCFEQKSPLQFKSYQEVTPHLAGKFQPSHPPAEYKRICEL